MDGNTIPNKILLARIYPMKFVSVMDGFQLTEDPYEEPDCYDLHLHIGNWNASDEIYNPEEYEGGGTDPIIELDELTWEQISNILDELRKTGVTIEEDHVWE